MPLNTGSRAAFLVALLAGATTAASCGKDARNADATPSSSTRGSGKSGPVAARSGPSITLAATDVATIAPGTIEEGTPLTGDLHPSETIDVRARIDGDLTNVYVREGEPVAAGQLLARFESTEQESSQRSAEADRAARRKDRNDRNR